eukprot:SAG31_NODE_5065_length_2763_cov_1.794670_3_plen_69_part_00
MLFAVDSGYWAAGKHHGKGRKDWGDGIFYEGSWVAGKMHGSGVYMMEDGFVMEGSFEADEFVGEQTSY